GASHQGVGGAGAHLTAPAAPAPPGRTGEQTMRIVALTALLFFSTYACFVFVHHRIRAYDSSLTGRADMLDVLRGLCANGVFCAHMVKAHALFQLGTSKALDHSLFLADYLGDLGVGVFFLI